MFISLKFLELWFERIPVSGLWFYIERTTALDYVVGLRSIQLTISLMPSTPRTPSLIETTTLNTTINTPEPHALKPYNKAA